MSIEETLKIPLRKNNVVRIDIRRKNSEGDRIKDKNNEAIGNPVKVKIVKNKVAPPFKEVGLDLMYGEGISVTGEILDLSVDHGILKKSGAWFSYEGKQLANGRDATKALLKDNPELLEELKSKIIEAINAKK